LQRAAHSLSPTPGTLVVMSTWLCTSEVDMRANCVGDSLWRLELMGRSRNASKAALLRGRRRLRRKCDHQQKEHASDNLAAVVETASVGQGQPHGGRVAGALGLDTQHMCWAGGNRGEGGGSGSAGTGGSGGPGGGGAGASGGRLNSNSSGCGSGAKVAGRSGSARGLTPPLRRECRQSMVSLERYARIAVARAVCCAVCVCRTLTLMV
jgi:hypothetical protein